MIFVPAYNEEATVGTVVKELKALSDNYRVIVIDDGSRDNTRGSAKKSGGEVVSLPFHCGGAQAVALGYRVALISDCKYLVKVDADGQHKPTDVETILQALRSGSDVAVGSRYQGKNRGRNEKTDSLVKDIGRKVSSSIISRIVGSKITDVTCGLRGWRRDVIGELIGSYEKNGYADDSVFWLNETILLRRRLGKEITEVPVSIKPRLHGSSKSFTRLKMVNYPVRVLTTFLRSLFWK